MTRKISKVSTTNRLKLKGHSTSIYNRAHGTPLTAKSSWWKNKTNNIMVRDILRKLEITLTASKKAGKKKLRTTDTSKESNIKKGY